MTTKLGFFVGLLFLSLFIVSLVEGGVDRTEQNVQMEIVKLLKAKQKRYGIISDGFVQQKKDFYDTRVKQTVLETQDALTVSSSALNEINLPQSTYDSMISAKTKDLMKAMSMEMELNNLISLTKNSESSLGEQAFSIINVRFKYQTCSHCRRIIHHPLTVRKSFSEILTIHMERINI